MEGEEHDHRITSRINLIDLAGSERCSAAHTSGERLKVRRVLVMHSPCLLLYGGVCVTEADHQLLCIVTPPTSGSIVAGTTGGPSFSLSLAMMVKLILRALFLGECNLNILNNKKQSIFIFIL